MSAGPTAAAERVAAASVLITRCAFSCGADVGIFRTRRALFSDAEAREDLSKQIVRRELAGDRGERELRLAQLLGEEFDWRRRCYEMFSGGVQMRARVT